MSKNDQSIESLASAIDLPKKTTKQIVEYLKHDMLVSLYRKNPEYPVNQELIERNEMQISLLKEDMVNNKAEIANEEMVREKNYEIRMQIAKLEKENKNVKKMATDITDNNYKINNKINELYKKWYKQEFSPKLLSKNKQKPLFLMGPPGQGKTASYIAAAKEVCAAMELNFVEHVSDNYVPKLNDFLMVTQECAGANSDVTFGGLPKSEEITLPSGEKRNVLKSIVNYRFTLFDLTAGGVFLLDDASNAPSIIQNILLPIAQFGSFRGLKINNALFGFTGNLGALDGTSTSEQSSALITRVWPIFTTDTMQDFILRAQDTYNDDLGTVGYISYLTMKGERNFAALPRTGAKSGFKCSRTHEDFIKQIRSFLYRAGGIGNEENILQDVHDAAVGSFGIEAGNDIFTYYTSYTTGAAPLARYFIMEGKSSDTKRWEEKFKSGVGPEALSFSYSFVSACADYAISRISSAQDKEKELKEVLKYYGESMLRIPDDGIFSYGIDYFKNTLAAAIPEFVMVNNNNANGKELNFDIRKVIAMEITALSNCSSSKREVLIKTISDMDKYDSNTVQRRKSIS